MAEQSGIEYVHATWNITSGCTRSSAGCQHCWAEPFAKRLRGRFGYPADEPFRVTLHRDRLDEPFHWRRPRRVLVSSMGDLFHCKVPAEFIAAVFGVMGECSQHTFLLLTKRAHGMVGVFDWMQSAKFVRVGSDTSPIPVARARGELMRLLPNCLLEHVPAWPLPNVWLGVSIENADNLGRLDELRKIPAAVRFASLEPLLGDLPHIDLTGIDWVIVGGETGPGARPMRPNWVRSIRDECAKAGVPFFFKGWGHWHLPALHGWPKRGRYAVVQEDGTFVEYDRRPPMVDAFGSAIMLRVPRKRAGRRLDDVEHNEYPTPAEDSGK